jgi:hypothetical protein
MRPVGAGLAASFRPTRIPLVTFGSCGLFIGVAEIQLGMMTLRLQHLGPLRELSRLAAKG